MSPVHRARGLAFALAAVAVPLGAQHSPSQPAQPAEAAQPRDSCESPRWAERLSLVASYGQLQSAGKSEWYALLNRALQPGARALDPRLGGAAVHFRFRDRWELLAGYEGGGRTVSSTSVAQAAGSATGVAQQTRLSLQGVASVGVEWRAWRWRRPSTSALAQFALGAGGGRAAYRARQWGAFVDAARQVAYNDDFRSSGHGALGYVSAIVEAPVASRVAVRLDVRQQWASAPMNADYASFDRLDLGGTRLALGVRVRGPGSAH
ncbi:MAG: hypothetical protein U0164_23270 [Gemmatimonadaceae bacterium]